MEIIKDLPFPTISFIVGAIALIIAIARNVSIKEINIRMTLGQSLVLGFIGLILMGIGIYGHFFTPTVPEAMVSNAADTPFETPFATRGTSLQSYLEMNERPATGQELGSPNGRFILSLEHRRARGKNSLIIHVEEPVSFGCPLASVRMLC